MIVYRITNTVNGKVYIGQTSRTLRTRWTEHKRAARLKLYVSPFFAAIRKYGESAFLATPVCDVANDQEANELEAKLIEESKGMNYNLLSGGVSLRGANNPRYGKRGQRGRLHWLNRKSPQEREEWLNSHRRGINGPNYGASFSAEHCKKISETLKRTKVRAGHRNSHAKRFIVTHKGIRYLTHGNLSKVLSCLGISYSCIWETPARFPDTTIVQVGAHKAVPNDVINCTDPKVLARLQAEYSPGPPLVPLASQ